MFDVFYIGTRPNLFVHEREVSTIEQAQELSRTRYFWIVNYLTDYTGWDFLWEPVPWQAHQRHAWPSQWQRDSGTYLVPKKGYSDTNYHEDRTLTRLPDPLPWIIPNGIVDWDTSWHPDPGEPAYNHEFATQWHAEGGPVYHMPGSTDIKYHARPQARWDINNSEHWQIKQVCTFDHSWRPHPKDPPYIYVFGNQWHRGEIMPTVEYHVPGAVDRKFLTHPRAQLLTQYHERWHALEKCTWDTTWQPDPGDPPYIYVFGNQWHAAEVMPSLEYRVPGATERKYMSYPRAQLLADKSRWTVPPGIDPDTVDYTWQPDPGSPPYIYQFGTQWQRTGGPRYTVPGATDVKYVNAFRTIRTQVDDCWVVPEGADVDSFDWTWHPDDTDASYIYQFGTQHQRTGGPQYRVPGATEVKYVDQIRITTQRVATAIYEIDHMDGNAGQIPNTTKTSRYFDNYLDTLKRIAKTVPDDCEFIWICSSVCDYTAFDFSWHPEQWQATMLHVFASDGEKFGDTFFMHVPSFRYRSEKCQLLEWYDLNFVEGVSVPRRPLPVIEHSYDTHVEAVKTQSWSGPLAVFATHNTPASVPCVPLWREKTKTVVPMSAGATTVIVPKAAVPYIKTQIYDYPYIDKTQRHLRNDQPLDVVFISNGEVNADYNYEKLKFYVGDRNRVQRVDRVNGRVAAYHAAAQASSTPWFFAVFAKLEVEPTFDWSWQPDRLQQSKHYIFHARNPVNGLIYGHQAMIAYNRRLTLANTGTGLDFTLDDEHEVVPVISGTAHYCNDAWTGWRTAFREVLKLKSSTDVESQYRLRQWLKENNTSDHYQWSHLGAQDAVEYYNEVAGDFTELKKSYEWAWLATYAMLKRGLAPE